MHLLSFKTWKWVGYTQYWNCGIKEIVFQLKCSVPTSKQCIINCDTFYLISVGLHEFVKNASFSSQIKISRFPMLELNIRNTIEDRIWLYATITERLNKAYFEP